MITDSPGPACVDHRLCQWLTLPTFIRIASSEIQSSKLIALYVSFKWITVSVNSWHHRNDVKPKPSMATAAPLAERMGYIMVRSCTSRHCCKWSVNSLRKCPFAGHDVLCIDSPISEVRMCTDAPSSTVVKAWMFCRIVAFRESHSDHICRGCEESVEILSEMMWICCGNVMFGKWKCVVV